MKAFKLILGIGAAFQILLITWYAIIMSATAISSTLY